MIGLVYAKAIGLSSFYKYISFSLPNFFRKNKVSTEEVVCPKCGKKKKAAKGKIDAK